MVIDVGENSCSGEIPSGCIFTTPICEGDHTFIFFSMTSLGHGC